MATPAKRKKSSNFQFRRVTPKDIWAVRDKLEAMGIRVTREVNQTLGTSNPKDAKREHSKLADGWEQRWDMWRKGLSNGPASLTTKQIAALAGDVARRLIESDHSKIDDADDENATVPMGEAGALRVTWEQASEVFRLIESHGIERYPSVNEPIEQMIANVLQQGALIDQGIIAIDQPSQEKLKLRIVRDLPKMAKMVHAIQRDGNYSKPQWLEGRPKLREAFAKAVTFDSLINGWSKSDAQPKHDSVRNYGNRIAPFIKFIGHNDVLKVKRDDVLRYKTMLLAQEDRSLKGIKLKLDVIRTMITWGIKNGKLPFRGNPASDVGVSLKKDTRKMRGYSDSEARMILVAARKQEEFLRWGTWLMAYSGMRAGEVAQLRVSDVIKGEQGQWSIKVTGDAGTVKTKASERTIPLHSAVIKEGFPVYVKSLDASGRLFPELYVSVMLHNMSAERVPREVGRIARDRMRRMLGGIGGFERSKDAALQHAWRHRMSSLMREHCQRDSTVMAMLGHKGTSITDGYGQRASLERLREEIERVPVLALDVDEVNAIEVKTIARAKVGKRKVQKVKLVPRSMKN
jgi:integrase